jgi:hypothetical protein
VVSKNSAVFAIALAVGVMSAPIFAQATMVTAKPRPVPADNSGYRGEFTLHNDTGVTVYYQVKWGSGPWKPDSLRSGYFRGYYHPLDRDDSAPRPYVRFDRIGGDNGYTAREYEMDFHKVGPGQTRGPKKYVFKYASDGKQLDIKAR